jgi:hypothetical protein
MASNVLSEEIEEFKSNTNFKEYFKEKTNNFGFPAADIVLNNPFKTTIKLN